MSFCLGTHTDVELLDRAGLEARRWRYPTETALQARQRIAGGNAVRREAVTVEWDPDVDLMEEVEVKMGGLVVSGAEVFMS